MARVFSFFALSLAFFSQILLSAYADPCDSLPMNTEAIQYESRSFYSERLRTWYNRPLVVKGTVVACDAQGKVTLQVKTRISWDRVTPFTGQITVNARYLWVPVAPNDPVLQTLIPAGKRVMIQEPSAEDLLSYGDVTTYFVSTNSETPNTQRYLAEVQTLLFRGELKKDKPLFYFFSDQIKNADAPLPPPISRPTGKKAKTSTDIQVGTPFPPKGALPKSTDEDSDALENLTEDQDPKAPTRLPFSFLKDGLLKYPLFTEEFPVLNRRD